MTVDFKAIRLVAAVMLMFSCLSFVNAVVHRSQAIHFGIALAILATPNAVFFRPNSSLLQPEILPDIAMAFVFAMLEITFGMCRASVQFSMLSMLVSFVVRSALRLRRLK